jgi:hypothetical protein
MAVDERRNRCRQLMTGNVETAQNFSRDILRRILSLMFCGIECDDSKRVTVLARHQIADGAFEIGLAEISLYEGRTELSVNIDDEIIILIVAVRHNRGRPILGHQRNSQRY